MITVNNVNDNVNDAPILASAVYNQFATEDSDFSFTVPNGTFTDPDGDTLTYTATLSDGSVRPSWLSFNTSTRTFNGTPTNSNVGEITIKVTASDGSASVSDSFTLTVVNTNDAPTVNADTASLPMKTLRSAIDVLSNDSDIDGDTLTVTAVTAANGTVVINSNNTLNYTPNSNFNGAGTITYSASDGTTTTAGTVSVTVNPVNDAPTVNADTASTNEDTADSIDVLSNDSDIDGDTLTVTAATAANGTVVINSNNTLNYTPNSNFNGADTITYSASDGTTTTAGTVSVIVNPVNDAPTTISLSGTSVDENAFGAVVGNITVTDPDSDIHEFLLSGPDATSFEVVTGVGGLPPQLKLKDDISADFESQQSYSVTITATDSEGKSITSVFNITVVNLENEIVTGQVLDGYVAGATVFQDLNNNGVLDAGEPSTTTDALGNFTLTLSTVSNTAPVRIITGFDLATNEIHPSILEISSTETGSYIITPISTLIGKLKADDANLTTATAEQQVATALGLTLTDAPNDSLLGYDPLALMNSSDATEAAEAKPVYAANQLLMSLAGGSYRAVTYTVNDVLNTLTNTLQTIVNNNGGGTITLSVSDEITLGQKAYDALFNSYVDAIQDWGNPFVRRLLNNTLPKPAICDAIDHQGPS